MILSILWSCTSPVSHYNVRELPKNIPSDISENTQDEDESDSNTNDNTADLPEDEWSCESDPLIPTINWTVDQPENHGMDSDKLQLAAEYAEENDSDCLVVVRDGAIVGEWYWGNHEPFDKAKSWSVAKSYASTVVGLAIDHGFIEGVDESIGKYIPELIGTEKEFISIHELLSMISGVRLNLIEDNLLMAFSNDMTKRALENPVENYPGARWEYNNHTVQLSEPLIRYATGMPADEFADLYLWKPLGIDANWERDRQDHAAMYMNVKASCRDHAKFAYLMLKEGCWDGEQILSREWVSQSTQPSSQLNRGYGYWWWVNGEGPVLDSVDLLPHEGILHPQAPSDAFCGAGFGSQMLEVIPSEDMVIVRFGPAPHENINYWIEQNGVLMEAMENDGKQIVHNGVLSLVLDAIVD